ncbi:uncharacterized protein BJ171DRAFT_98354 [Polychytrium aggregatum]|uniref:uncharacterized protein n=1 Tax=Polychytrium aggregatum TaxID=110093 RepID=UPI0022FDEB06|nr:uncharacterized protein BJ171DRAFT_98354 [Polychytrium aggregatum]KAI9204593.1 hypothetical protein BJ171DRAFT_98354 [Polychytrium aggregatum]
MTTAASCIDLGTTTDCKEFAGNYIVAASSADADNMVNQGIGAAWQSAMQTQFACPNFDETSVRYRLAAYCGLLADIYTNSAPSSGVNCPQNANRPATAHQICPSALQAYLSTLTVQYNGCDPNNQSDARAQDVATYQHLLSDLSSTDTPGCISVMSLEQNNTGGQGGCGFHTTDKFVAYCTSNPTDPCCNTSSASSSISATPTATTSKAVVAAPATTAASRPTAAAAPSPTPTQAASGTNIPLIAGAAGGAAVLLIATVVGFLFLRRRKSKAAQHEDVYDYGSTAGPFGGNGGAADNIPVAETMQAIYNYVPNLSDELYIYVGDTVIVKSSFDDGWAFGFNMTTKQEGTFPLACLAPFNAQGQAEPGNQQRQIKQRASSLYIPQGAN